MRSWYAVNWIQKVRTDMKAKISEGNTKIGNIPNVSHSPIKGCPNGVPCAKKGECYAIKAYSRHKATTAAWNHNFDLLNSDISAYFNSLDEYLTEAKPNMFRIHVAGDFLNQAHLDMWKATAAKHSKTKFLAFTKQHGLDYNTTPQNLTIVFSMWPGFGDNQKSMPRAWMLDPKNEDSRIPKNAIECSGTCESCGMCWSLNELKRDVFFRKH